MSDNSFHVAIGVAITVFASGASIVGGWLWWKRNEGGQDSEPQMKSMPAVPVNGSAATVTEQRAAATPNAAPPPPKHQAVKPKPNSAPQTGATGGPALLARMRAQKAAAAEAAAKKKAQEDKKKMVTFIYASQTGTAEEIAKSLHDEAVSKQYKSRVLTVNEWACDNLNPDESPVIVAIASTTGDGDPPDNSGKGLIKMKKVDAKKACKQMKYTVMGLGDSNYTNFMRIPRTIGRLFRDAGAEEFYESKEADEVDGLEDIVDAWRDNLWDALAKALSNEEGKKEEEAEGQQVASSLPADYTVKGNLVEAGVDIQGVPAPRAAAAEIALDAATGIPPACFTEPTQEDKEHRDPAGRYTEAQPFWAQVRESVLMTAKECSKRVLHVSLDITGSGMSFLPGDAFGVAPANDPALVQGLLSHLSIDGSQRIKSITGAGAAGGGQPLPHLRVGGSVEQALTWCCDLTSPPAKFALAALAECTGDAREASTLRYLSSRDGRDAYKADISTGRPTLLQLLQRYPSCKPAVCKLLEILPPLRPRMYSLTNSQAVTPDRLEVAFHVVEYDTHTGPHGGVATTWLERRAAQGAWCRVHMRPPTGFRPPEDHSCPIIMVGPGTGVAPFRGFLQHRAAAQRTGTAVGANWLFFGNWRPDWDYLFEQEFAEFVANGVLDHLHVAWSRESDTKVYVQDKIRENGAALCELLVNGNASVFVCGDGAHMAKDVEAAFKEVLVAHGGAATLEAAAEFMKNLASQKRYLKDVWL